MRSTLKTIIVLILLSGWVLAGASLHVVRRTDDWIGLGVVPKNRLGFTDTYVDVRFWTTDELANHPDLLRRLIATDKTHWVKHIAKIEELPEILEKSAGK